MRSIPKALSIGELSTIEVVVDASVRDQLFEKVIRRGYDSGRYTFKPAEWRRLAPFIAGRWPIAAMELDVHLPEVRQLKTIQRVRRWGYTTKSDITSRFKENGPGLFE